MIRMIAVSLGSNIEGVYSPERKAELKGHRDTLPPSVTEYGKYPEEIFAEWETISKKAGTNEMKHIPMEAVAMYEYTDKLACGLQQFMTGARKFDVSELTSDDLISSNLETEYLTGIPFMTDALDEKAGVILNS